MRMHIRQGIADVAAEFVLKEMELYYRIIKQGNVSAVHTHAAYYILMSC